MLLIFPYPRATHCLLLNLPYIFWNVDKNFHYLTKQSSLHFSGIKYYALQASWTTSQFVKKQMIDQWLCIDTSLWLVLLFPRQTLNFEMIALWAGDVSPSFGDMTKTGEEDLDKRLFDHWLRRSWQQHSDICTGCKFLLTAVAFVLWNLLKPRISSEPTILSCPWSMRLLTRVTVFLTLGKCSVSTREDFESKGPHRVICSLLLSLCFIQHYSDGIENRSMGLLGKKNFYMTG